MLQIQGLEKNYGSFRLRCSLQVQAGQVTGLVGQNGAGKSTTFKCALGLTQIDGGTIHLMGRTPDELTAEDKQGLGVALSDSGFSEYLSLGDIIPVMSSFYPAFDANQFRQQCTQFGLPLNKKLKEFSTGMRAKAKLLLAMSHRAKLLILDEPTAGLDVVAREDLLDLLRAYMEEDEGRAVLISSHISSDLEGLCDDIYMIHQGQIVLHQDTDVLLGQYGLLKATAEQYGALDKQYLLRVKREPYGYSCLTDQKQFYQENYPQLAVENGSIDRVMAMMIQGEDVR